MRIVAITVGAPEAGSTRFRLMQYRQTLESLGAKLEVIPQDQCDVDVVDRIKDADVVINQKCLLGGSLARHIIKASRYLVFDFDDAIYTRPGRPYGWLTRMRVMSRFKHWLRAADVVTVANHELASASKGLYRRLEVLPMAVDVGQWQPRARHDDGLFRLGWVGAPNNLPYLERLDPILNALKSRFPQLRVAVFCGKKPNLTSSFDYVPFSPGGEVDFIQQLDVGLLPLEGDEYSRAKSPIKAIQYLACGVPVVGNVYGATGEICTSANSIAVTDKEGWMNAIASLIQDRSLGTSLGYFGRQHILAHHDAAVNGRRLWEIFERREVGSQK